MVSPEMTTFIKLRIFAWVAVGAGAPSVGQAHAPAHRHVAAGNLVPVERLGPLIENHPRFPEKANVGFVCITGRDSIDLRVFERGVGETAACGTGACAAVVTGQRLGLLQPEVSVRLPGGQVVVSWRGGSEPVWLTGNAEYMSEGLIEL